MPTITLKVMQTVRHIRATRRIARNSPANMDTASSAVALGTICRRNHAVGRLDGMTSSLPDLKLFLYSYVRKEAVLSSQIEGTQSSLSDLLLYENAETPGVPLDDVQEVSNYVAALNHGLKRMRDGFPLSFRLIREIHEVLWRRGAAAMRSRDSSEKVRTGLAAAGPAMRRMLPLPEYVMDCMGQLETFIHQEGSSLPLLIKAGLVHAQFESIHPFLDGNAVSEGYSLPSCSVPRRYCANPFFTSVFSSKGIGASTMTGSMKPKKAMAGRHGWTSSCKVFGTPQIKRRGLPAPSTDSSTQTRKRLSASAAVQLLRSCVQIRSSQSTLLERSTRDER